MPTFKRLTRCDGTEVYVNLDRVQTINRLEAAGRKPERTLVYFQAFGADDRDFDSEEVLEVPSAIVG